MAQRSSEYMPVQATNKDIVSEKSPDISAQITAQVAMALGTLDSRYKENIAAYAEELHECTHQIETARIELDQVKKEKEPYSNDLHSVEKEIDHEIRLLEHLTEQWTQKAVVVSELEAELKHLSYSPHEGDAMLNNRYRDLKKLHEEIEDLEVVTLKHELEKQNLLLKIEPIDRKINRLLKTIQELESRKRYIESSYLHRITQVAPAQQYLSASSDKTDIS